MIDKSLYAIHVCCSMLYYITLYYTIPHYIIPCYGILQCAAYLHYTALHCIALHYTTSNCPALHCTALHHLETCCIALHYTTSKRAAFRFNSIQFASIHFNTIRHIGVAQTASKGAVHRHRHPSRRRSGRSILHHRQVLSRSKHNSR